MLKTSLFIRYFSNNNHDRTRISKKDCDLIEIKTLKLCLHCKIILNKVRSVTPDSHIIENMNGSRSHPIAMLNKTNKKVLKIFFILGLLLTYLVLMFEPSLSRYLSYSVMLEVNTVSEARSNIQKYIKTLHLSRPEFRPPPSPSVLTGPAMAGRTRATWRRGSSSAASVER